MKLRRVEEDKPRKKREKLNGKGLQSQATTDQLWVVTEASRDCGR
jgi:hypothetical protein